MVNFCEMDYSVVYALSAYAAVLSAIIIGGSFMVGQVIRNPKVTVWAKTEIIQLVASFISLLFMAAIITTFCSVDMGDIAEVFDFGDYPGTGFSIYEGAESYLRGAAIYSHNALTVVRYHLEGFTVLAYIGKFECDLATGPIGWGCYYGYSGENLSPFGGYGAINGALTVAFNSTLMSYMMALNYLFILRYVYHGFVLFLMPIGIFTRSLPYMRSFGSVLIATALSFMFVYPIMLAVFDLMGSILINSPDYTYADADLDDYLDESIYKETSSGGAGTASIFKEDYLKDKYDLRESNVPQVVMFAAQAFIAAFFFPSLALIATIASTVYLARLYGEEIDLSRIMQMV
jgi:hypothetical protein